MTWWIVVVASVPIMGAVSYGLTNHVRQGADMGHLVLWCLFWPLALLATFVMSIKDSFE